MSLLSVRLCAALNAVDAGLANPGEAEAALAGQAQWVKDPDRLLQMSHRLTVRIGLAQVPRRLPGPWALLLVAPGHLGGLRGPTELNTAALSTPPDANLGAVGVVALHHGGAAWHEAWEPVLGAGAVDAGGLDDEEHLTPVLRLRRAERVLLPPTPREASQQLHAAMAAAVELMQASGFTGGQRPDAATTVQLGEAYPHTSQTLLDLAMTVLRVVQVAAADEHALPHAHAMAVRSRALDPLRQAAWAAVSSAVSWPEHAMR